jgi:hypothetical protein
MRRLVALIDGLPTDSLTKTPPDQRDKPKWTVEDELLAQLIEEVSILAAEQRRKKPRQIPRPGQPSRAQRETVTPEGVAGDNPYSRAMGVLAATNPAGGPGVIPHD